MPDFKKGKSRMKVPWISKKDIADRGASLIEDFQARAGYPIIPPIPVDEIVERSLGLTIRYMDLSKVFGSRNVLGATYAESRLVLINERLFEHSSEGRLVFTCAHEAGHWVLHRRYAQSQTGDGPTNELIVCTTANAKEPIEWQADYFASRLLMPERDMRETFQRVCCPETLVVRHAKRLTQAGCPCEEPFLEQWPYVAAAMCEAGGFSNVSRQAMIIRLQDLGLVVNRNRLKMDWEALRP
jgi:Zn-dependent peptidase ImmA (M78 family)